MRSYQLIKTYLSSAKETIKSTAQTIWESDTAQALWQGFTVPVYSYTSMQTMIDTSEDLDDSVSRAFKLNASYALHAVFSYFFYYRMLHPALNEMYIAQDSDAWAGAAVQSGITAIDTVSWAVMYLYLTSLLMQNTVQNFALTTTSTYAAGKVMPKSDDFKPCACKGMQVARANGEGLLYYAGNRYLVTKICHSIGSAASGWRGKLLEFGLEAASFGVPLVEYKFSAVGRCGEHRYTDILSSYKAYSFAHGASFVATTWGSYKILSAFSGEENPFIYDAVFSFMFQMYALMAIAREKKFPGNDRVTIDFVAWFKYFFDSRPAKFMMEKFLGDMHSLEALVQSPGVALMLKMLELDIKNALNSVKDGLQQIKDFQSSRLYHTVKWMSDWLPANMVPDEVKTACKSFSKTAVNKFIHKTENLLDLAREAEALRNAQSREWVVTTVEDHFKAAGTELKPSVPAESVKKPEVDTYLSQPKADVQKKEAVVLVEPQTIEKSLPESKSVLVLRQVENLQVQDNYFKEKAVKEERKQEQTLFTQHHSPTLFAKKEHDLFSKTSHFPSKRREPLAAMAASVISGAGKSKALK